MKHKILAINIAILAIFFIVMGLAALFSEHIMCYGDRGASSADGTDYFFTINEGGCLIDQRKVGNLFQHMNRNGHDYIKWIAVWSLSAFLILLLSPKNIGLLKQRIYSRQLIAIYIIGMTGYLISEIIASEVLRTGQHLLLLQITGLFAILPMFISDYFYLTIFIFPIFYFLGIFHLIKFIGNKISLLSQK